MAGREGTWAVFVRDSFRKNFLRGDDGTFLYRTRFNFKDKKRNSSRELILAKPIEKDKNESLTIQSDKKEVLLANKFIEFNLDIKSENNISSWLMAEVDKRYFSDIQMLQNKNQIKLKIYVNLNPKKVEPFQKNELKVTLRTLNNNN